MCHPQPVGGRPILFHFFPCFFLHAFTLSGLFLSCALHERASILYIRAHFPGGGGSICNAREQGTGISANEEKLPGPVKYVYSPVLGFLFLLLSALLYPHPRGRAHFIPISSLWILIVECCFYRAASDGYCIWPGLLVCAALVGDAIDWVCACNFFRRNIMPTGYI